MNTIHILSPSGAKSTIERTQLQQLWEQGLIQEGTEYWIEGMEEWKPLRELFENNNISRLSALPPPKNKKKNKYLKDPRDLTSFLIILLWINLAFTLCYIIFEYYCYQILSSDFTEDDIQSIDNFDGLISIAYLPIILLTAISFLRWIYRANLNCRGFGAEDMKFTPFWSIGCYFIPWWTIYKPYQAMKEIWRVSHSPTEWKSQRGSPLLVWWWTLWIASAIFGLSAAKMIEEAESVDDALIATLNMIFSNFLYLGLCLTAMSIVKTISRKQEEYVSG
jgi:hypothetical protein